jgi:hypothetical protein
MKVVIADREYEVYRYLAYRPHGNIILEDRDAKGKRMFVQSVHPSEVVSAVSELPREKLREKMFKGLLCSSSGSEEVLFRIIN